MLTAQQFLYAIIAIISLFILNVKGQEHLETCPAFIPHSTINATDMAGVWYGASRSPAHQFACVEMKMNLMNNGTQIKIITSHAALNTTLLSTTKEALVDVADLTKPDGFIVKYNVTNEKPVTYKIMNFDESKKKFVLLCGYTDIHNPDESFGLILSRERIADKNSLDEIKGAASEHYYNFQKDTVVDIQQSDKCSSSASAAVPVLITILGVVYSFLKFVH
uniref:Lipocalin/cytosolic fatty-acid binding domain-containing protein n=1 Tax=Glossina brevipalpis TaxID=37001 RepID=A0A1A9W491_9MUSC